MDCNQEKTVRWLAHPGWILLFAGIPLAMAIVAGPLYIDDAYITFRYAENIARGHGFVYNTLPIPGTTAPFYCLLLAGLRAAGIPIITSALWIGALSAAAAPVLCWRAGISSGKAGAGFLGAFLLSLFPWWWLHSQTGMETTLAGALAMAAIYLDLRGRGRLCGVACGLLVLTRPDCASLPGLIIIFRALADRKKALQTIAGAVLAAAPWLVYAVVVFGSFVPQSLPAKSLIHHFPAGPAMYRYASWFTSLTEPPGMIMIFCLWAAGLVFAVRSKREFAAAAAWPVVFIIGLALTRVGPFFWYKMPAVPAFFFIAGLGVETIAGWKRPGTAARIARVSALAAPGIFLALQLVMAAPYIADSDKLAATIGKESILKKMAGEIRARSAGIAAGGRRVSVYAGEVGVLGFELMDCEVIDSSGINSREVYEIRKRDWERMRAEHPESTWQDQWSGSLLWSQEIIEKYRPDFIASDLDYLHLRSLAREPWFERSYRMVQPWRLKNEGHGGGTKTFVLFERAVGAVDGGVSEDAGGGSGRAR